MASMRETISIFVVCDGDAVYGCNSEHRCPSPVSPSLSPFCLHGIDRSFQRSHIARIFRERNDELLSLSILAAIYYTHKFPHRLKSPNVLMASLSFISLPYFLYLPSLRIWITNGISVGNLVKNIVKNICITFSDAISVSRLCNFVIPAKLGSVAYVTFFVFFW